MLWERDLTQEDLNKVEQKLLSEIENNIKEYEKSRGNLIPILQMIQEKLKYLPKDSIEMVAKYLEINTCEVYGVATFYNQFRFNPPGNHPIKVCLGTACHVKGADIILENFERKLEILEGETTPDREFSIDRVACVGCCALAPVTMIGDTVQSHMAPSKVEGLILRFKIEKEMQEREKAKNETAI
ncbi:MAG: NADH-quinone oxidoreductase subunit NuoE [Desulfobacterales bacterium]|nr:NADH-quinone oxidoreductase subunit NuoE [Desulfobacterales bacterium]MBF0398521.1 NADH-quinone oxidoreductase subunit NuoE [Desulfobacterales bacterium]